MWKNESSVLISKRFDLPGFHLTNFQTSNFSGNSSTGEYSILKVDLNLKRDSGYYLATIFIPTTMLVFVCWLSFSISTKEQLLKTAIPLISLITFVIMHAIWNRDQPRVSYPKSIDLWLTTCHVFNFFALFESTMSFQNDKESDRNPGIGTRTNTQIRDSICAIMFPIIFLVSTVVYILVYTHSIFNFYGF